VDVEDLRTFVALATTRSFSQAARQLFLTQPGVTRRLQRLEHALGATLVDRRRRPLALTSAGEATLERSQQVLDGLAALRGIARGGAQIHRELRVGVAHALTEFALVEPVERARRELPRVAFLLSTGWSRDLAAMVRTGHLDAAFVLWSTDEAVPRGIEARALADERLVAIAARSRPRPRDLRALDGAEWILNPEGCAARASVLEALRKAQIAARVAVETYTYETQLALVSRDRGLGMVPERLLQTSRHRRAVRRLGLPELEIPLRIWALHRGLPADLAAPFDVVSDELTRVLGRVGGRVRSR
jgi:DNA-binding transcriptional LysR family regulator